ncbi:kinase-like domain-containing protein [Gigaspora rosea]|uniref:Kinase-like domain-containing protein n=1 Tax=Gigaspora rosea TaxID=44941 RepID=A0A397VSM8_9GLOM|nr:kinase-like domain-containing protein [Gigaspora rosea]
MANSSQEWLEKAISEGHINKLDYNKFTYCSKIGDGGFGTVSKYEWKECELTIALKCLKADSNINKDIIQEFIDELMLLRKVCYHPHVIQFYGVTKVSSGFYMVLQFADGGNLREYLRRSFIQLQWTNKLCIAKEIAHGLMFLHNHDIVHRDLHSKNILIHQERAMIADFGLAKQMEEPSMASNSIICGMPAYTEPNCFVNNKYKRDKKSDIYSFGVILWEISSGKPPYQDLSIFMLGAHILEGNREKPIKDTPPQYVNLYEQCWDKDPTVRPEIETIFKTLKQLISKEKSIQNNNLTEYIDFNEGLSSDISDIRDYAIRSDSHASSLYLPDTINIGFSNIDCQKVRLLR